MEKISIAFDHRGEKLAKTIAKWLSDQGYMVNIGTSNPGDDYVDNALPVITSVRNELCDYGILICGTGVGMAIVANRFEGIFAVHARDEAEAHFAKVHENANVLVFGAGYENEIHSVKMTSTKAIKIVKSFLESRFEGGRHQRRIEKINELNKGKK